MSRAIRFNSVLHFHWLMASGSKKEALGYVRTAVQSHPNDLVLVRTLAGQLLASAKGGPPTEKDLAFLRTAVRSHPNDVDLAKMLAEQLIASADFVRSNDERMALFNEARLALNRVTSVAEIAASSDRGNVDAFLGFAHVNQSLCLCLVQLGFRQEAISVFQRLIAVQKSVQPRPSIDPCAADDYWRRMANAALTMKTLLDARQTSSPEDFVRTKLSEMNFEPKSEGHLGWCVIAAQVDLAIRMRRQEKREEANMLVAHMREYAGDLVARFPDDPLAHLAMYEAQIQIAKNAVRYKDAMPEPALRRRLIRRTVPWRSAPEVPRHVRP